MFLTLRPSLVKTYFWSAWDGRLAKLFLTIAGCPFISLFSRRIHYSVEVRQIWFLFFPVTSVVALVVVIVVVLFVHNFRENSVDDGIFHEPGQ